MHAHKLRKSHVNMCARTGWAHARTHAHMCVRVRSCTHTEHCASICVHLSLYMHACLKPRLIIYDDERVQRASVSTNKDLARHVEIIGDNKRHLFRGPVTSGKPALPPSNYHGWADAKAAVGLTLPAYDEEANRTFSEAIRELK